MPGETVAGAGPQPSTGFYGKVPTNGDFVQRNLSRRFLDPWDGWLQHAVAASKQQLADAWLDHYLTSPIWRFALSGGICGDDAAIGVVMPSVDSVGRYYPMTLSAIRSGDAAPFDLAVQAASWFDAAEEAVLSCLDRDFKMGVLESSVATLEDLLPPPGQDGPRFVAQDQMTEGGMGLQATGAVNDPLSPANAPALLDGLVRLRFSSYSLWWTAGSDEMAPEVRFYEGLPAPENFTGFLGAT